MDSSLQEQLTVSFLKEINVKKALAAILLISGVAFLFLIYLIYFRETAEVTDAWVYQLPALNAFLNSISTVLIIAGFVAIEKKEIYSAHAVYAYRFYRLRSLFNQLPGLSSFCRPYSLSG